MSKFSDIIKYINTHDGYIDIEDLNYKIYGSRKNIFIYYQGLFE